MALSWARLSRLEQALQLKPSIVHCVSFASFLTEMMFACTRANVKLSLPSRLRLLAKTFDVVRPNRIRDGHRSLTHHCCSLDHCGHSLHPPKAQPHT